MGRVKAASATELAEVVTQFGDAARVAESAGFDAIEIHLGHNYLLSSFLSPNLNRRTDEYGGSLENRLRFPRQVIAAVRDAVSSRVAVTAKFNMADGVPKGLWLDESLEFARMLEADGYFFRGDVPMQEFIATQPKLVGFGLRLYGPRIFPRLPFEEGFFLPFARQFREALTMPLILLGGINEQATMEGALAEGFDFVAMGRALLRQPDLPRLLQSGRQLGGLCVHCNKCMPTIYTGTRCVLVHEP
jgi:2,4-dienoyl-CoA reductase-like NADH-dependent reductase (Old Yellow Enzyme family)